MGCKYEVETKDNTEIKCGDLDKNKILERKHTLVELEPNLLTLKDKEKKEIISLYNNKKFLEEFSENLIILIFVGMILIIQMIA